MEDAMKLKFGLFGRIFAAFVFVTLVVGALATYLGVRSIDGAVRHEAQSRVTYDLRIARLMLENELDDAKAALSALPGKARFVQTDGQAALPASLELARSKLGLDYLVSVNREGRVLGRSNSSPAAGDDLSTDAVVGTALKTGDAVAGVQMLSRERLHLEGGDLVRRAHMVLEPTPHARPSSEQEQTAGMALHACVPIREASGDILGALVGGTLLNRNYGIVDRVKELVFGTETHKGKEIGTVTIFQWDVRISTNVLKEDGQRAIQTRVSKEVYDRVLEAHRGWLGRAFVVNDWYLTAYEPIRDVRGNVIGMLYVGVLEDKFVDMRKRTLLIFLGIALAGMIIALFVSVLI